MLLNTFYFRTSQHVPPYMLFMGAELETKPDVLACVAYVRYHDGAIYPQPNRVEEIDEYLWEDRII